MLASALLACFWVVYRCCLRRQLNRLVLLNREVRGPFALELRRSTGMCSHADGLGGQSYPAPIETRLLCLVCCKLPIWVRSESIGLPAGSEADFGRIGAADYDRHFSARFSIAGAGTQRLRGRVPVSG